MIDTRENAQVVVDLLNSFLEADPVAATALMGIAVPCSRALIDHPSIIAWEHPSGEVVVRAMGVINGLFSEANRVAAEVDEATTRIKRFFVADVREWETPEWKRLGKVAGG